MLDTPIISKRVDKRILIFLKLGILKILRSNSTGNRIIKIKVPPCDIDVNINNKDSEVSKKKVPLINLLFVKSIYEKNNANKIDATPLT